MTQIELSKYITECLVYEGIHKCFEEGAFGFCLRGMSSFKEILYKRVRRVIRDYSPYELEIVEDLLNTEVVERVPEEDRNGISHEIIQHKNPGDSEDIKRLKETESKLIYIISNTESEDYKGAVFLWGEQRETLKNPEEIERLKEYENQIMQFVFMFESVEDRSGLFHRLKPMESSDKPRLKSLVNVLRDLIPSQRQLCARYPFTDS